MNGLLGGLDYRTGSRKDRMDNPAISTAIDRIVEACGKAMKDNPYPEISRYFDSIMGAHSRGYISGKPFRDSKTGKLLDESAMYKILKDDPKQFMETIVSNGRGRQVLPSSSRYAAQSARFSILVRSVTAVLRVEPLSQYEEASATLGASAWTTFRRVVVPVAMPGILAGALMVVTVSLGEFNISWMLQTPYTKTLPVGLADSYASMRLEVGSAYTFIFFVILVPLLTLMQKLPERLSKRRALKHK